MNNTPAATRSMSYDGPGEPAQTGDRLALRTALRHLLALERRIKAALGRQLETGESSTSADAARAIARIDMMTDVHVRGLEDRLEQLGAEMGASGTTAPARGRDARLSESLRDDYAALSLAAISYTMLHTTALGFDDAPTAALAKQHLDDVAAVVSEIGRIMPGVVLQELLDDGLDISAEVRRRALRNTHESWRSKP